MSAIRKPESTASPDQPLLVDVRVIAILLGRSQQSISRDDKQGRLPRPLMLGSSKRWCLGEIEQWVAAKCPDRKTRESRSVKSETPQDQPSDHAKGGA